MVRTKVLNLAWQLGNEPAAIALGCEEADVLFVCEALTLGAEGPLDLRKLLPVGWAAFQDLSSAARAGSAVCWRTSTMAADGPGELFPGSPAIPGQRARYITSQRLKERATGDSRPYAAFHAPKRSTNLQDEFYESLDRYAGRFWRAVLGGDCNRPPLEVAVLTSRLVVHAEVMGIFRPPSLAARAGTPQTVAGSDHPIVRVTLATVPPKEPVVATYLELNPPAIRQFRRPRRATPSGVIVVHTAESTPDTVGIDTGAEGVARFIRDRTTYGSYHDLADSDSIVHLVPYNAEAYGDGTGSNPHAYHVSAATTAAKWPTLPREWREDTVRNMARAAARYAKWLKAEHGITIPAKRITRAQSDARVPGFISHGERDPGRRSDPGRDFPWALFLATYSQLMNPNQSEEDDVSAQEVWNHKVPFKSDPDKAGDERPVYVTVVETHNGVLSIEEKVDLLSQQVAALVAKLDGAS